jgi:hypothetical protein
VHWDKGRLAKTVFQNLVDARPLLSGYEEFSVFSDMESISKDFGFEAFKLYRYFSVEYPDSIFILNTRNVDAWIKSRLAHGGGGYATKWKRILNVATDDELISCWRRDWERHHENVERYFAGGQYRFLKFDIETDSPALLNAALPEYQLDSEKYLARGFSRHHRRESVANG